MAKNKTAPKTARKKPAEDAEPTGAAPAADPATEPEAAPASVEEQSPAAEETAPEPELTPVEETATPEADPAADVELTTDPEVTPEPEPEPEPEPAPAPAASGIKLAPRAAQALEQLVGSYIGAPEIKKQLKSIVAGLESGKQLCIVQGDANVRFATKLFDQPFVVGDVKQDIPPRRDGVVVNVNRFLATKNLYPRG